MAAYGALISLTNTIDQILNHPRPPISLDKLQIKPLTDKVAFLQEFLENYIIDDEDGLEGRMVDAAHEAEDIIESHIVDHIGDEYDKSLYQYTQKMMVESDASHEANISSKYNSLYGELQKVIHDLDSITKDKKAGKKIAPCTEDYATASSDDVMNDLMDKLNTPFDEGDDTMVGSNVLMNGIMDKLTNQQPGRQIIAIAGMGGIGKTTLAKRIYENPLIVQHFHIRGWATVSQEFDLKRILLELLHCYNKRIGREDETIGSDSERTLGLKLHESLFGLPYLIVMDDIWGTDALDRMKRILPDHDIWSRVLITTRLPNVALQLDGLEYFQMPFMKVDESWNLLRRFVFQEQRCPPQLEEIGKDIAKNCGGLPLSVVMIGGLLAKSEQTQENWQRVAEKVAFLQDFLENYNIDDADGLEGRIVDAAHEAEDIIDSHFANHFENEDEDSLYRYIQKMMVESDASHEAEDNEARGEANISSKDDNESLYGELQKVIHDLDSITKDVAAIKDKKAGKKIAPCTEDYATTSSDDVMNNLMDKLNPPFTMLGSNDVMNDVMDKLTNLQFGRRIIAIAGMGGIGKTTLAKRIYEEPLIVQHFHIRGWATVSQEFDSKRILLEVLDCLNKSEDNEDKLGEMLYKSLIGQRYLIVMDDVWGTDAWDRVKRFFPDNNNGSRVLITTRLSNVALQLDEYFPMSFLEVDESWKLLRGRVFGEQGCPPELEGIGKDIAMKCRGLPLSIVVIGGLLAKSEQTQENWQRVAENLSSTVNLEKDEHCFKILKLSYNQLPVHLKPCFLYMGMFPEDDRIDATTLIRLWVDEGFVKPLAGKSMKTTARVVYLHDLVIRNLIMVRGCGPTRRIKRCGIHDLLRDLCIKEAEKYKFFRTMGTTTMHNNPDQISWRAQRRIAIHPAGKYISRHFPKAMRSASRVRTLIWNLDEISPSIVPFRLLRILNGSLTYGNKYSGKELFLPVNLRHLVAPRIEFPVEVFYRLWNLQTLIAATSCNLPVLDIWRMPQLRHVKIGYFQLTDPPPPMDEEEENGDRMVLENLETLKTVYNSRLSDKVVERIPNIRKLRIHYTNKEKDLESDNLCRLRKLEDLAITGYPSLSIEVTSFPIMLRKLFLQYTYLRWEEMGTKIGSLPFLEDLKLWHFAFVGAKWETSEGGFQSLKYLQIVQCSDLEQWRAEATPFPRLEQLDLEFLDKLNEIPKEIGDILTLRKIYFNKCSDSALRSAYKISDEQEECLGETTFKIDVCVVKQYGYVDGKYTVTRRWGPLR